MSDINYLQGSSMVPLCLGNLSGSYAIIGAIVLDLGFLTVSVFGFLSL